MSGAAPSIEAALAIMFERLHATAAETVPLAAALGRTLAAEVLASADIPPWDNAAMDGYACRAADIADAAPESPVTLPVVATIAAGATPPHAVRAGEAMRIMTGAPVPPGADSVVRVEHTDAGTGVVAIKSARDAGANIRPRGGDLRAGDSAVVSGSRLTAAELAMLAAVGCAQVEVHRPPRVAILCSGDELVSAGDAGKRPAPGIVSANSYSLAAVVAEAGGEPLDLGIVPDDMDAMTAALRAARDYDLVVTSGGISVGGYDYTRPAVAAAGGEVLFWRLPMRPGYNSAFGTIGETPWLGVPGNPVSALVAGEILLRPSVRWLCGSRAPLRARSRVTMDEPCLRAPATVTFLRATIEHGRGGLPRARLSGPQGSAVLSSSVRADALLVIPPGERDVQPGDEVEALLLRDEAAF